MAADLSRRQIRRTEGKVENLVLVVGPRAMAADLSHHQIRRTEGKVENR
jgi:hypothetical protein